MSALPGNVHIALGIIELIHRAQTNRELLCHEYLGNNHLLLELWNSSQFAVENLADIDDIDDYMLSLKETVADGGIGDPVDVDQLLLAVKSRVASQGEELAKLPDFIYVVLEKTGHRIKDIGQLGSEESCEIAAEKHVRLVTSPTGEQGRKELSIPTLLQFGSDLTQSARDGKLLPVVGRDSEVQLMIETLCRRTKRNPMLVGAAGVGKTAIVEGFAQRVARGEVPDLLAGATVIMLQPSLIVSGGGGYGELEERMNPILAEAAQDGVILFIDEVHSIIGAGGATGRSDIASLMKPALARGDISCIAATTDEEFRRHIEPDSALERRFQPIRVQEMNTAQVLLVLQSLRDDLKRLRGVFVADDVLARLIDYAGKYMRNRTFPDKAVDLLEECVANALARGDVDVDISEAGSVVQRKIGMPLDIVVRINALRKMLLERRLLSAVDIETLTGRLQVTMRGLDIRMVRPNAILLLAGSSAGHGQSLAEAISGALFESVDRIVKIDFGRFNTHHDISLLLGSPPSYVGYNDPLPIHRIKQYPWCVALFDNVDAGHESIQQVLGQALTDGYFVDGQNRKIYLSDVIVVMTAPGIERKNSRAIGFQLGGDEANGDRALVRKQLDAAIVDSIDLICFDRVEQNIKRSDDLRAEVLGELAERFKKLGMNLQWDESIFEWIDKHCVDHSCQRELERLIDERLCPAILAGVDSGNGSEEILTVRYSESRIVVGLE